MLLTTTARYDTSNFMYNININKTIKIMLFVPGVIYLAETDQMA